MKEKEIAEAIRAGIFGGPDSEEGGKRGKKEERREIREEWKGAKKTMAGYEVVGDESAGESE